MSHDHDEGLAPVVHLRAWRLPDEEAAGADMDTVAGELVLSPQRVAAVERYRMYRSGVQYSGGLVRTVATHQLTKTVATTTAEAAVATGQGFAIWAKKAWDASTLGVYRRQIASAEAQGDKEGLVAWIERRELAIERRHRRLLDLPQLVGSFLKIVFLAMAAVIALVLVTGIILQLSGKGQFLGVIDAVLSALGWIALVVSAAWTPFLILLPFALVFAAYRTGRRQAQAPTWLQRIQPERSDRNTFVTSDAIAVALRHLGIAPLNAAFKKGWQVKFVHMPHRDGDGMRAVFEVPLGVSAKDIADQRKLLARNLIRAEIEVWPTTGHNEGVCDLWVANPGTLNKPAGEYPLLHAGTADYFTGVPMGITQRGDALDIRLYEANFLFGGLMGQGKSNGVRALVLGAALDPLVQLWVFVFAFNGDFDAYTPRLARYHKGANDDVAPAAVQALHELYDEVSRRELLLAELGAKKVTRKLAEENHGLRPIVAAFSEVHELFRHPGHGPLAAELAVNIVKKARKTAITLVFDTQSAKTDAIPRALTELVSVNACFAVRNWQANDGFLGDGCYSAGIRATELRPGVDRGTCLMTGVSEAKFELVRTYYIEADDDTGYDAAKDVIDRSLDTLAPGVPTRTNSEVTVIEQTRDLLEDLDEALGHDVIPASQIPALLIRLAPHWSPYRTMTIKTLTADLAKLGVKIPSTGNRWPVDPAAIRQALATQATADLDT